MPIIIDKRATPWVCFEVEEEKLADIVARYRAQNIASSTTVIVADARAIPVEELAPLPPQQVTFNFTGTNDDMLSVIAAAPDATPELRAAVAAELEKRSAKKLPPGDGPSGAVEKTERKK